MSPLRAKPYRGLIRWTSAAAIITFAPKCLVCIAAYVGVGAAFGLRFARPEICGGSGVPLEGLFPWLAMLGAAVGVIAVRWLASYRLKTTVSTAKS